MRIYIGGNNGVGKTTLLREFKKLHNEYEIFTSSQVVMQTHNLKSREEIKNIKVDNTLLQKFYDGYNDMLLDAHFYLRECERTTMDLFIFMTAKPEIILNRRKQDNTRIRELTMESVIKEEQDTLNRIISSNIEPVFVLDNNLSIENTLKQLEKIIYVCTKIKEIKPDNIEKFVHKYGIKTIKSAGLIKTTDGISK